MKECAYCPLGEKRPATSRILWFDENQDPDVGVDVCDPCRKRIDRDTPGPGVLRGSNGT